MENAGSPGDPPGESIESPLLPAPETKMPPPGPGAAAAPIQLGVPPPYLRTHGAKMARRHMYDWIVLLLLAAIEVVLNLITPFHRFVAEFMMDDLRYPMKPNTIPVWAVPIYAVILPMLIFAAIYVKKKNAYDLHHAILGLLFSVLITGVLTDAIKDGVGRPRPNFYYRCFPDGVPVSSLPNCFFRAFHFFNICHAESNCLFRTTRRSRDKSYATETQKSSKKGTRASPVATLHGPLPGWASCRGTLPARSGCLTGADTLPSSAS
uniref:Phosphatidic acid phosphatase type 2/haloperoxidase domain-containing protein n=2 Tax=Aegilops tauschii subsp. strangulata TaxID=200361 RepID=A0A452ZS68_AEGTS